MYRLIYTSAATEVMSERDLQKVLRSARRNNATDGITGLLIYHDGCFFQVLEGDEEAVEACYKRIAKDPRHRDSIVLMRDPIVTRTFSDWWMSYRTVQDLQPLQRKQLMSLEALASQSRQGRIVSDLKTNAIILAFLSAFRDLDMAG